MVTDRPPKRSECFDFLSENLLNYTDLSMHICGVYVCGDKCDIVHMGVRGQLAGILFHFLGPGD